MSLTAFTLKKKTVVLAILSVAMAFGVIKYFTMPRRSDPVFTIRVARVTTSWPGAPADRIEQLITAPLEEEISSLAEVDTVSSANTTGLSVISVELADSVPVESIQETWEKVRAKVENLRASLPPEANDPIVNDQFGDTAVMLFAVYEKPSKDKRRYSMRSLETIADRIRERIAGMDKVASARLDGVQPEVIHLETSRGNWANLKITLTELQKLISDRNTTASGGSLETTRSRVGILPAGEFDAVQQIETLVIDHTDSGAPIYLRDIGLRAQREYQDPATTFTRYGDARGNAPCILVSFTMKKGAKITELGPRVRRLIANLQDREKLIPPDIAVDVVFDESVFVAGKISDFTSNVIQAIVIVIVVAMLMAGLRSALVMAAAIPFVMVISIGVSSMFGVDLEQMSIASLIIALGLLVDNAVVVCDNVRRFQKEGYSRLDSVIKGVEQIQYPILMGTLTTVFAFLPLAFALSGSGSEYIYSIPVVVSTTLLVSWVLALTVTPLMAYWVIRPSKDGTSAHSPLQRVGMLINRLRKGKPGLSLAEGYGKVINTFLGVKPLVIGLTVLLLVGVLLLPVAPGFFPNDERDVFYVDIWLPEGSSVEQTEKAARKVEKLLQKLSLAPDDKDGVQRLASYYTTIGGSGPKFTLGVSPQPPQSNFSQIVIRTTDPKLTDQYVNDLRVATAAEVPGARILIRKLALGPPVDFPIAIRINGGGTSQTGFASEKELRRQSQMLQGALASLKGVRDVHDSWGQPGHEVYVDTDPDQANLASVTNSSVANSFAAYYSGFFLTTYREGDHTIPVYLRLSPEQRKTIPDPRTVFVEGKWGKVPVDSVADISLRRRVTRIERRNQNRVIEVRAAVSEGFRASEVLNSAQEKIDQLENALPPGFWYEIAGENEKASESATEMGSAFGIALILIILCLIVQYNSLIKPFVVLSTVPMGVAGGLFGLWVTDNALGFMPMLGLVSLAGIVVNSGILYLEFADEYIRQKLESKQGLAVVGEKHYNGLSRKVFRQCLADAGSTRLLPIVLTVSTTVGGLIPLALFGGPLWEGMAYLLIAGLLVATVLTLLVLPIIYALAVEWFGVTMVSVPDKPSQEASRASEA
jgi:multidrug efflux pump